MKVATQSRPAAETELERIAREALAAYSPDFQAAAQAFKLEIKDDPRLLTELVGEAVIDRLAASFVRRMKELVDVERARNARKAAERQTASIVRLEPARSPRGAPPPSPQPQPARPPVRTPTQVLRHAVEDNVLFRITVGNRWLGQLKRAELEIEAAETSRRAMFFRSLLALMPPEPDAEVGKSVPAAEANRLWTRNFLGEAAA